MTGPILTTALEAHRAGLHPIPIKKDGSKGPCLAWKRYMTEAPSEFEVHDWFRRDVALGLVMGRDTECLDFDSKDAFLHFATACAEHGLEELWGRVCQGYTEETPNGFHVVYRCPEIEKNQKLARTRLGNGSIKALIETRGEGGYIIAAPSNGTTHETGRPYQMVAGGLSSILTLTPAERTSLLVAARAMDDVEEEQIPPRPLNMVDPTPVGDGNRPGDEFVRYTTWAELLKPHGWRFYKHTNGEDFWTRPGKKTGISATTNFNGSDLLYVFSTSTVFESERGYNKFSAYALLEHDGDFKAAARALRDAGFGQDEAVVEVDISQLSASTKPKPKAPAVLPGYEPPKFPEHLLEVPGLVGELASYILRASPKRQPVLSLGAAIATIGTVIGRKVATESDVRSNIYVLGVAESGAGKEAARKYARRALGEAGADYLAQHDDMSSGAAINTAISSTPSALFLLDEIGRELKAMAGDRAPAHIRDKTDVLLKLYNVSDSIYYGRSYADRDRRSKVYQPNLSIYGTTVPDSLWESMSSEQVRGGLLSRFLIFMSEDPDPEYRAVPPADREPPSSLVEGLRDWTQNDGSAAELARLAPGVAVPEPSVVRATDEAKAEFNALEERMRKRRAIERKSNGVPELYTRVGQAAQKLALIRACGISREEPTISGLDAMWACELAEHCTSVLAWAVGRHVADDVFEKAGKVAVRALELLGGQARQRDFFKRLRRAPLHDKRLRDSTLALLVESGDLVKVRPTHEGAGRPGLVWMTRELAIAHGINPDEDDS